MNTTEQEVAEAQEQAEQPAERTKMPIFEWQLHAQACTAYNEGRTEASFLREKAHWRDVPPEADSPNEEARDRLEQAVSTLRERGKWPWDIASGGKPSDLLSVAQTAELIGVTEGWIRKAIARGLLPARRVGDYPRGVYVVKRRDAEAYRTAREAHLAYRYRRTRGAQAQQTEAEE